MSKLSKEQIEAIQYSCLDESTKVIQYLEEQNLEQQKHDNLNLILNIISVISSIGAFITGIIAIIN